MLTALDMLKHADKEVKELSGGMPFDKKTKGLQLYTFDRMIV